MFREQVGNSQVWPTSVGDLLHFAIFLHEAGMGAKLIQSLFPVLVFHSKALGLPEFTSDFPLWKMLEGWSREAETQRDDRRPITPEVLRGLFGAWKRICSSEYKTCLFHAASLVAFLGCCKLVS